LEVSDYCATGIDFSTQQDFDTTFELMTKGFAAKLKTACRIYLSSMNSGRFTSQETFDKIAAISKLPDVIEEEAWEEMGLFDYCF